MPRIWSEDVLAQIIGQSYSGKVGLVVLLRISSSNKEPVQVRSCQNIMREICWPLPRQGSQTKFQVQLDEMEQMQLQERLSFKSHCKCVSDIYRQS